MLVNKLLIVLSLLAILKLDCAFDQNPLPDQELKRSPSFCKLDPLDDSVSSSATRTSSLDCNIEKEENYELKKGLTA